VTATVPEPLLRQLLGAILRDVRTEQGRTLQEVSQAARVSMPHLSEVERGRTEASSEILAAVTGALGLRLADLLAAAAQELADREAAVRQLCRREPAVRSLTSRGPDRGTPGSGVQLLAA
jgi:transcriptional regulator with XRE-family HTH domain